MVEPIDAQFGTARRLGVEVVRHRHEARDERLIAAQRNGVAAVDRHDRDRRLRALACRRHQRLQRRGDFARAGVFQRDDLAGRRVAVDARRQRADAADIVGEVGDDQAVGVAVRGQRALRADQRAQSLNRCDRVDVAQADDFGDELVLRRAVAADAARLRRRAVDRLNAIAAVRPRHGDEAVRAQGGEENLEIFAARQRAVGDHRHLAVDPPVDDEGAPGDPRGILDEGADVGVADVERILRQRRGRRGGNERGGKHQGKFEAHGPYFETKMAMGTTLAPRSTSSERRAPGVI